MNVDQLAHVPYWQAHYREVARQGNPWLDFSNDRVQLQHFTSALEGAGSVVGQRCLDVGCGRGQLARALVALGAARVVALEPTTELIEGFATRYPDVEWLAGDVRDGDLLATLGPFDRIFAVEMLQYVPLAETIERLCNRLTAGGRLVAVVPNRACPWIERTEQQFAGHYRGTTVAELGACAAELRQIDFWGCRGLAFAADQRIAPYGASAWTREANWSEPPNRLVFVAQARGAS